MKQVSITLKWPLRKIWILNAVEDIIKKKEKLGLKSSVSFEISRMVENYLTGALLGKGLDREILKNLFSDVLEHPEDVKLNDSTLEDTGDTRILDD